MVTPPAIHGELVAGSEAAQAVRNQLEELISGANKSQFDIAEVLHVVKSKSLYTTYGFSTFPEYAKTLKIKESRTLYLTKMVECFSAVGIPRSVYEPLGITRCRYISSLDPKGVWINPDSLLETPLSEFIKGFVEKGESIGMDLLKQHVRTLKGIVGVNDISFRKLMFQRTVAEETWDKAIELVKHNAGSAGKDADGMSKDISDEYAAEMLAVSYLNDPSNNGSLIDTQEETNE